MYAYLKAICILYPKLTGWTVKSNCQEHVPIRIIYIIIISISDGGSEGKVEAFPKNICLSSVALEPEQYTDNL